MDRELLEFPFKSLGLPIATIPPPPGATNLAGLFQCSNMALFDDVNGESVVRSQVKREIARAREDMFDRQ